LRLEKINTKQPETDLLLNAYEGKIQWIEYIESVIIESTIRDNTIGNIALDATASMLQVWALFSGDTQLLKDTNISNNELPVDPYQKYLDLIENHMEYINYNKITRPIFKVILMLTIYGSSSLNLTKKLILKLNLTNENDEEFKDWCKTVNWVQQLIRNE
jgi:hypothetical protein